MNGSSSEDVDGDAELARELNDTGDVELLDEEEVAGDAGEGGDTKLTRARSYPLRRPRYTPSSFSNFHSSC